MIKFGIAFLVGAAALGYLTYTEGTLAFRSSEQPEEFTLKNLIARGPDGNANIVLTNFVLCENLAYQFNQNKKDVWTHVWIPIVPIEEAKLGEKKELLNPRNVKALFFSTKISGLGELEARLNKPKVQGMVTNRITSLESKIRDLLKQNYPETDFDKCLIIQEGRTPFGRGAVYGFGAGALLCLFAGVGLILGGWLRSHPSPVQPVD